MLRTSGDILEFDGYIVGRLRADIPATVRDRLDEAMANACLDEDLPDAKDEEAKPPFVPDESADELRRRFEAAAQGGFLSVAEAVGIVAAVTKGE